MSKSDSLFLEMPAPKEQLMLTGPMDSDIVFKNGEDVGVKESLRNDRAYFGVRFEVSSFRNMLLRIKWDVVRRLKWMDLSIVLDTSQCEGLVLYRNLYS